MTKELTLKNETALSPSGQNNGLFFDIVKFEHAQRVARCLCTSALVPDHFKGEKNIGSCLIALNLAERMQVDPFLLMQNIYVVHGKPGIEAKLAIAIFNTKGDYTPIEYKLEGSGDSRECTATAKHIKTGQIAIGECSIAMAKAEGWYDKNGSKWKTLPDLMLRYRSASFLIKTYNPGILMGLQTKEEMEDIIDVTPIRIETDSQIDLNAPANAPAEETAPVKKEKPEKSKTEKKPSPEPVSDKARSEIIDIEAFLMGTDGANEYRNLMNGINLDVITQAEADELLSLLRPMLNKYEKQKTNKKPAI